MNLAFLDPILAPVLATVLAWNQFWTQLASVLALVLDTVLALFLAPVSIQSYGFNFGPILRPFNAPVYAPGVFVQN